MTAELTLWRRLRECIEASESLLCVGLDPDPAANPSAAAVERSCLALIEATEAHACAFKPNIAFFECHGSKGYAVLERLRSVVSERHFWLVDAKRGDIGSTAVAYVAALFDVLGADAVTVNPLMGEDSVRPFLERAGRGAFLLTRTSNPGAADLLDQRLESGVAVYEHIAALGRRWDTARAHGLVVGATDTVAIGGLRRADPEIPLLVPGVGAQGGSLEDAVRAGVDRHGGGLLLSVSRGVSASADGPGVAARALHRRIEDARVAAVTHAG